MKHQLQGPICVATSQALDSSNVSLVLCFCKICKNKIILHSFSLKGPLNLPRFRPLTEVGDGRVGRKQKQNELCTPFKYSNILLTLLGRHAFLCN